MQTFIPYFDFKKGFEILDVKRHGKQRLECIEIIKNIIGEKAGWKNHPAVKMWKPYLPYLVYKYTFVCLYTWSEKGYENEACCDEFIRIVKEYDIQLDLKIPPWITQEFCRAHQSNLIRKKPEYYKILFPGVPDNLPYIWPNMEGDNG